MEKLKPCPFCGKETQVRIVTLGGHDSYACMTGCMDCDVTMRRVFNYSISADEAIEMIKGMWNRRVESDERRG